MTYADKYLWAISMNHSSPMTCKHACCRFNADQPGESPTGLKLPAKLVWSTGSCQNNHNCHVAAGFVGMLQQHRYFWRSDLSWFILQKDLNCFDFAFSPTNSTLVQKLVGSIQSNNQPPIPASRVLGLASSAQVITKHTAAALLLDWHSEA